MPASELRRIELELTKAVSLDVSAWRLDPLRQQLEAWTDKMERPADETRVRELLRRIGEFEQLQNRAVLAAEGRVPASGPIPLTASPTALPSAAAAAPLTAAAPPVGSRPPLADTADAVATVAAVRYDGSGWLVPVHSTRQTAPPYALLDSEGNVLQYVSPAPGMNLHRYLRKQVGIYGQRGYLQSLQKPHVTAERIVDLNRHFR